ncbi:transporter for efflux [Roseibium sp. TrichSKD4]|uniref:transporter for efflux n=1 Tax=Roseibium sp. TrichSKD4 TaxID=744980 RepID=UPI0001E567D1|nr:transporter for efflux [Roseibium sp. TrichSKD4]EFO30508.1 transporter for efflux [Roseibium sp. TrichSKD4]
MMTRKVLRKSDKRWIGWVLAGLGVLSAFLIKASVPFYLNIIVPIVLISGGIKLGLTPSSQELWIEGDQMFWRVKEGKNLEEGQLPISEIKLVELKKKGMVAKNARQWIEVELQTASRTVSLNRNFDFGGTLTPKIEDVLDALRAINPSISYKETDFLERKTLI